MQDFADLLLQHQGRLIGWCARLCGDADAAEDLAQETIIQAWRIRHKLTDTSGIAPWLYSIARYVCLRWRRQRRIDGRLEEDWFANTFDLEAEFEQREIEALLDKALTWLPPETRSALVAHYVDGQPPQHMAARLGITENALAVRLHRGKRALHHTIKTHLRAEAQAYGLLNPTDSWQSTRLWCYVCGQQHLQADFDPAQGNFTLRCVGCGFALEQARGIRGIVSGVHGIKSVINRLARWSNRRFVPAGHQIDCGCCGQSSVMRIAPRHTHRGDEIELDASCPHCGSIQRESLYGQAIHLPEGQQFWRTHERIRILPHRFIEIDERRIVQTTLQSVRNACQLHVLSAYDTGQVLRVETSQRDL